MRLSGAQKVEEAGKIADYKALRYARQLLESEPEYLAASDTVKESMMKTKMLDTMEKRSAVLIAMFSLLLYTLSYSSSPTSSRRIKGQDTMSKLAAFKAQDARALRTANEGPTPRATIPRFLEENGYVPARPVPQNQLSDPIAPDTVKVHDLTAHFGTTFSKTNTSPNARDTKPSVMHAPFANMTPEPMESIETDPTRETAPTRNGVDSLYNMGGSASYTNNDSSGYGVQSMRANDISDKHQVNMLDRRLSHLENVVRAMQNVLVPAMEDRLTTVETSLEKLKSKVGEGCEAEVAKMREVFGGMRETMARVGNFL